MDGDEPRLLDRGADSPFQTRPIAPSGGGGWDGLGNGGLVSTAGDFARLLQMLLNRGELDGVRLLGSQTVELMLYNHLAPLDNPNSFWDGVGFGMGFAVLYDRERFGEAMSNGTIWWAGSTNNYFWMDREQELIGVMMTQVRPFLHGNVMDLVGQLTYQAIVGPPDSAQAGHR
jgi:CubicO group peptidase (beta-lactamase class C family)